MPSRSTLAAVGRAAVALCKFFALNDRELPFHPMETRRGQMRTNIMNTASADFSQSSIVTSRLM
jgi:hypothetical protein